MPETNYFCHTIQHLRHYEEVLLSTSLLHITDHDEQATLTYLTNEYTNEATGYPAQSPRFDAAAAVWAAKTVYHASQLFLFREHKDEDLLALLPPYGGPVTEAAMLSADLTLRFLPDLVSQLRAVDPDDRLIMLLEKHLSLFHYSAIRLDLNDQTPNLAEVLSWPCLSRLYIDRIISIQNIKLARHPVFQSAVRAALGIYASQLWPRLHHELITEHEPR